MRKSEAYWAASEDNRSGDKGSGPRAIGDPAPGSPAPPHSPAEGVRALEPLSFEGLYNLHFAFTWRVLDHLGVPRHTLDDAAQEVWLVVHRRLADFEGRSELRTWLFGITLNVVRNQRRALARRPRFGELADLANPSPDPEALSQRSQAFHQVQRFMDTLDEQPRAIFVCNLLESLSAADTAAATGVDVTTVYQSIRTLRRWLKAWLDQEESEPR